MRIISGTSKGRRLVTPKSQGVRPTSDRIKESIFNILGQGVDEKVVLDLYAGTGNLGIESLSRGAKRVLFVEKERQAIRLIKRNLSQFGMEGRSEIVPKDVCRTIGMLEERGEFFDLIFMDPPYEKGLIQRTLTRLSTHRIHRPDCILVIQHDRREPLPDVGDGWNLIRQRRIGDTLISFLTPVTPPP